MNREAWLTAAIGRMAPWFAELGHEVPSVRVSVGWPGGRGKKPHAIGQCWSPLAAEDGVSQIFISPALTDPITVLATLLHEMIHAVDQNQHGHRREFGAMARPLGLEGKLTATVPGEALTARLAAIREQLGDYPHARLALDAGGVGKQTTRMLKIVCTDPLCGYTARTTQKWLDVGLPTCACGLPMEVAS